MVDQSCQVVRDHHIASINKLVTGKAGQHKRLVHNVVRYLIPCNVEWPCMTYLWTAVLYTWALIEWRCRIPHQRLCRRGPSRSWPPHRRTRSRPSPTWTRTASPTTTTFDCPEIIPLGQFHTVDEYRQKCQSYWQVYQLSPCISSPGRKHLVVWLYSLHL